MPVLGWIGLEVDRLGNLTAVRGHGLEVVSCHLTLRQLKRGVRCEGDITSCLHHSLMVNALLLSRHGPVVQESIVHEISLALPLWMQVDLVERTRNLPPFIPLPHLQRRWTYLLYFMRHHIQFVHWGGFSL